MTRLSWDSVGKRVYETGVDRGVLYVEGMPAVPWTGLVSVSEKTVGGENKPYYIDGIKFLNVTDSTEFEATIEAITYPDEFALCEGIAESDNVGLFATNQYQRRFGLCYRTLLGSDTAGTDLGYKLHFVYNALATPSDRPYSTTGSETSPINFSWSITTTPVALSGFRPTAHYVADSRHISSASMANLENAVYGSASTDPRLPAPSELRSLLTPLT